MIEEFLEPPDPVCRNYQDERGWWGWPWYWETIRKGVYTHAVYVLLGVDGTMRYVGSGGARRPFRREWHDVYTAILGVTVGKTYALALESVIYDRFEPQFNHHRPLRAGLYPAAERAAQLYWDIYGEHLLDRTLNECVHRAMSNGQII